MKKHKQKPVEPPSQNESVETIGNNQPTASNGSVEHDGNSSYPTQNVSKELNKIKSRVNQVRMLMNIQLHIICTE